MELDNRTKAEDTFQKISERIRNRQNILHHFIRRVVPKKKSKLFLVSEKFFIEETAGIISKLFSGNKKGIVVTFDLRTRDLADELVSKKIDIDNKLFWIDAISYPTGHGAPPVINLFCCNRPAEFDNLFYYCIMHLHKIVDTSPFIVFISPYKLLDYTNCDEIGVFLHWFVNKVNELGIQVNFIYKKLEDELLRHIIFRLGNEDS